MEEGAGAEPSPAGARPKKKNRKMYDLTAADKFWQKHKGRSVHVEERFSDVVDSLLICILPTARI